MIVNILLDESLGLMKNILYIIVCGYLFHFALADGFLPKNGAALNYTQIQFKWPQINGYDKYRLP